MAAKNLTLDGKRFVILPEAEYRMLRKRAGKPSVARQRAESEDAGDVAEALRRLADLGDAVVPYAEARKRLGLK